MSRDKKTSESSKINDSHKRQRTKQKFRTVKVGWMLFHNICCFNLLKIVQAQSEMANERLLSVG